MSSRSGPVQSQVPLQLRAKKRAGPEGQGASTKRSVATLVGVEI